MAQKKLKRKPRPVRTKPKRNYISWIISFLLIGLVIFNIGSTLFAQREKYTSPYWNRFAKLKQIYFDSQYVNKHPHGWVPDESVYAYAGGAYIRGANPILILPEVPPLGKYLIGLSILIFNNENIIIIVSMIISILFLYLIGRQIFSYTLTILLVIALITSEALFKNQLIFVPLFDMMQLMFLLGGFYFFNRALKARKFIPLFIVICLFLGFFISTKFFASGITIALAYYIVLFIHKDGERILSLTIFLPLAVLILLLTYIKTLFDSHYTLFQFLGIQKWILLYHKSQLILPFSIWPLLLLNKWYIWWGNNRISSDPQWQITWPIVTILSLLTIALVSLRRISTKAEIEILMVWIICYFFFLSVGDITSRYFIILIPVMYLVAFYGIEKFYIKRFIK